VICTKNGYFVCFDTFVVQKYNIYKMCRSILWKMSMNMKIVVMSCDG
jgi:hypothetical protein